MRPRNLFRVFTPTNDDLSHPRGYILLEVGPDTNTEDTMRMSVQGDEPLHVNFTGKEVFTNPLLHGYNFTYTIIPAVLKFRDNMVTTDWLDVRDSLLRRELEITDTGESTAEEFVKTIEDLTGEDYRVGASLRWAVQATTPTQLAVVLQTLPISLAHIKTKAIFKMDNCPAVALRSFDLTCRFQRGRGVTGPIPTLFAAHPQETETSLREDPTWIHTGKV